MAISASTVYEVRTTGSDTACSGGFVTGASGTDYSQQAAAQYSLTGLTSVGAGNIILTSSASADMVGNIIRVTAGTNFTFGATNQGFFQITAVSVGVSITVSTNNAGTAVTTGVGAAGTAVIGGALASPGLGSAVMIGDNIIWVKAGTYSITSASTNVSGGCLSLGRGRIEGYNAARGDLGTKPLFQASGISTATLVATTGGQVCLIRNLAMDGVSLTSIRGAIVNSASIMYGCAGSNCTNSAFNLGGTSATIISCSATGCSTQPAYTGAAAVYIGCTATANTVTGFSGLPMCILCISSANTGASSLGFTNQICVNCTAYGNGSDGFKFPSGATYTNCASETNTGAGYNANSTGGVLTNCAGRNNTGGNLTNATATEFLNVGFIACTAEMFTNPGSGDFSLNATVGGGAACRAAGLYGAFPGGLTTGFQDIGAAQHQDPAGGTVSYPLFD